MCIFIQLWNYFSIKRKWKRYVKNKQISKTGSVLDKTDHFFILKPYFQLRAIYKALKKKHKMKFKKVTTDGTLENFVFMALLGLIFGFLISIIFFYSEFYMGEATLLFSFTIRLPLMIACTLYIAFKQDGRCLMMLAPLQLFSAWGQQFLKGEVIILIVEGPLLNLKHNIDVIKESSACQQRGAMAAAAEVADILFGPFASFQQAARELVKGIKAMVEKLQNILNAFKRTVMAVADAIQDATRWINSKINGCKNTVGTTYKHCMDAFTWMYDECKVSVPSIFVPMCSVTEFASNLCSSVKPGEYLCDLVYFNVDPLVTTISQRISRLMDRAYTLMHFEVNIHHEYSMDSNSKSIAEELVDRLKNIFDSAFFLSVGLGIYGLLRLFFTFLFLWHSCMYKRKYLRKDYFDNYFITEKLRSIDLLESLKGNESIFPLRRIEQKKYVKWNSIYLIKKEFKDFSFPTLTVFITGFVVLVIGLDHVLYFVTDKCRLFMLAMMQSASVRAEVNVEGNGFIAELSRRVVRSLNYMDYDFYHTHLMPCIPNPKQPNSLNNHRIAFFLALIWISWGLRPYILRLRHIVMDYYRPDVYTRRARWLHNSILVKRATFVSLMSVKLRSKHSSEQNFSVADILRVRFPWISVIIGKGLLGEECMICSHLKPPLYRCTTDKCLGIYCDDCYTNIKGVCSICKEKMRHPEFENVDLGTVSKKELFDDDEGLFLIDDIKDDEELKFSYQEGSFLLGNTLEIETYFENILKELSGADNNFVNIDPSESGPAEDVKLNILGNKPKDVLDNVGAGHVETVFIAYDTGNNTPNKFGYSKLQEYSPKRKRFGYSKFQTRETKSNQCNAYNSQV